MKYPRTDRPNSRFLPSGVFEEDASLDIADPKRRVNKAVFLDRDGTINAERGYLLDPGEVELCPTAGKAIQTLNQLNIPVIVITNQAAIDKRLLSLEQFESINEKLWDALSSTDAHYDALYYCPHSPEITPDCPCRKPKPGLILQAAKDFKINLQSSFMIGDKLTDIEAGRASGCKTILVLTGRGEKTYHELKDGFITQPDFVAATLEEAVKWILQ